MVNKVSLFLLVKEQKKFILYKKDDPKPLIKYVYEEIKRMLFGKDKIIKENSSIFDKNDQFLMNIFKKEIEGQDILSELEMQEEQVKSIGVLLFLNN